MRASPLKTLLQLCKPLEFHFTRWVGPLPTIPGDGITDDPATWPNHCVPFRDVVPTGSEFPESHDGHLVQPKQGTEELVSLKVRCRKDDHPVDDAAYDIAHLPPGGEWSVPTRITAEHGTASIDIPWPGGVGGGIAIVPVNGPWDSERGQYSFYVTVD
jgi:hypothetical protein